MNFLTGLLEGVSQGVLLRRKEKEREEERKLRETLVKSTERLRQIQEDKLEQEMAQKGATFRREESGREKIRQSIMDRGPTEETEMGDQPIGDVPYTPERRQQMRQEGLVDIGRPQDLQREFGSGGGGTEGAIEQYRQFLESQGGQMPGGMQMVPSFGPSGMRLRGQLPVEGGAERQLFAIERKIQNGTATPEEVSLYNAWLGANVQALGQAAPGQAAPGAMPTAPTPVPGGTLGRMGAARTGGAATGREIVRGSPLAREGARNVAEGGAAGRRQVEAREKLKDVAGTEQFIEDAALLSTKINTAKGGIGRFTQGAQTAAGAALQTNTDAADLNNLRDSYSLALARSILAERGVLTNQDRQYATNTFPSIWDTRAVADRKLFRMRSLAALQREGEQALASDQPFDVESYRRRWRRLTEPEGATPSGQSGIPPDPQQPQGGKLEILEIRPRQ